MQLYRKLADVPANFGPSVATIGNFDGVHRGHQWIISKVVSSARALGIASVAITFDPHPARVIRPESRQPLITPLAEKVRLLATTGLDALLILPFTPELARYTARQFVTTVLRNALHVQELHEGENFRFGYQAEAGVESLAALGRELGFTVRFYNPCHRRGKAISSTAVRALIAEGNVSQARALLGRTFSVASTPASGRGYGTRYAVPTINLAAYDELLPANGVYITTLTIGEGPAAETFESVTNIGMRPTFGADALTVESHLLNFHPIALTEQTPLTLSFLKHLRPEIHWPSPEALREQIGRDVQKARRYFALCHALRSMAGKV